MNEDPRDPAESDRTEQQAAAWLIRMERGLTATEQDEFLHWLGADRRHGAMLARHERNWKRLDLLGEWKPEHSQRPNRDLLAPPPGRLAPILRLRQALWVSLSLAAVLALGFFLWPPPPAVGVIEPLALIEERTLEDGSVVTLNRGAVVSVRYTHQKREVRLVKGEAHFNVARSAARPFVVTAGDVALRAVGTAFNVRLGTGAVDVLVTEGVVEVNRPADGLEPGQAGAAVTLVAGERTLVPTRRSEPLAPVSTLEPEEVRQFLAWQPSTLEFTAAPLVNVVNELNLRNSPIRIVISDTLLAGMEVSASLRSDNVEGFIRLLEAGFGVSAERDGSTIILRQAR